MQGHRDFDPEKGMQSLTGKVIFVTGGTAGLGAASVRALASHSFEHIYFTGRNLKAANDLILELKENHPTAQITFIEMDLSSLHSVKEGVAKSFKHDRLDILMNNAGVIAKSPELSTDGYEIQFATNHLGHAMLTKKLLPYLLKAAKETDSDVRIINTTSDGYEFHRAITGGISFSELDSGGIMSRTVLGPWIRYGHSKLANILFASEFARRYPQITSLSIHPGLVMTPMTTEMKGFNKLFVDVTSWMTGTPKLQREQGVLNQLWCAVGGKKEELRNGGFYRPVGVDCTEKLTAEAKDVDLAGRLWEWTESILAKY